MWFGCISFVSCGAFLIAVFVDGFGGMSSGAPEAVMQSDADADAVRQAVAGGCQSGWGRLLSVANGIEAGTCRQGDSGWT